MISYGSTLFYRSSKRHRAAEYKYQRHGSCPLLQSSHLDVMRASATAAILAASATVASAQSTANGTAGTANSPLEVGQQFIAGYVACRDRLGPR